MKTLHIKVVASPSHQDKIMRRIGHETYRVNKNAFFKKTIWHWRLMAGNNKILAASETYFDRSNCRRTATRIGRLLNIPVVTS